MNKPRSLSFLNLLHFAAAFGAIASFLGLAEQLWWGFELLDHPRPQYCLALVAGLFVGLYLRQRWAIVWLIPLTLNLVLLAPLFFSPPNVDRSITAPSLRLLHANLDRHNSSPELAIQYLRQQSVDLLFLQEVTPAWLTRIQAELPQYRVVKAEALDNSLGSAVLVPQRREGVEIEQVRVIHLPAESDRPLLETTVIVEGKPWVILSYHVIRSRSAQTSAYQQLEFNALANWSRSQLQLQRHVVVLGDFNSTPWSDRLRKLERQSQLVNSQRGFGLQPTWSASFPPLMKIAIDHCFHSRSLVTTQRTIGSNIGSDHFPVQVELKLRDLGDEIGDKSWIEPIKPRKSV
jgi:endonuclease/exonuclease/phosphatase (EEP) superfamily protein YafD